MNSFTKDLSSFAPIQKKRESMVDSIINKITDAVISGQYKPGDQLPTELKLAEMLGVSKNTVREAIRTLVAYGVVEIRRPEGTFICDRFSDKMLNPMLYTILFSKSGTDMDLIGLRQVVDFGTNELLVRQGISDETRDELEKRYAELKCELMREDYSVERIVDCDFAFHDALAKATGNELVKMINDVICKLTYESRYRTIEAVFADNNREYLVNTHRETLDIVEGKGDRSISDSVEFSYMYWKKSIKVEKD